jgi:hypothetical protein
MSTACSQKNFQEGTTCRFQEEHTNDSFQSMSTTTARMISLQRPAFMMTSPLAVSKGASGDSSINTTDVTTDENQNSFISSFPGVHYY